jgi:hypothetical protein
LFLKHDSDGKILIVSVYEDDLIYTGNDVHMMDKFKRSMKERFAMTDLRNSLLLLCQALKLNLSQQHLVPVSVFGLEMC